MTKAATRRLLIALGALVIIVIIIAVVSRKVSPPLPQPGSMPYRQIVSAFYAGTIALDVGENERAGIYLRQAAKLAPQEPACWANLGVYELRLNDFPKAQQALAKAQTLAPHNGAIQALRGLLAQKEGHYDQAGACLRRAVALDPHDLRARYALVAAIEQQAGLQADAEALQQLQALNQAGPGNPFAQIQLALSAAKQGDTGLLRQTVAQLAAQAPHWPSDAQQQFYRVQAAVAGSDPRAAVPPLNILSNVLSPEPEYQKSRALLEPSETSAGTPLETFIRLPVPPSRPAPADLSLTFSPQTLEKDYGAGGPWTWVRQVSFDPEVPAETAQNFGLPVAAQSPPVTVVANGRLVHLVSEKSIQALPFPGGPQGVAPTPDGILPVDLNFDFRADLVLAGAGGVRLFQQDKRGKFADVTARAKLPTSVTSGDWTGGWPADIDSDGDLDIVLGAASGPPAVLRSNGDGTFSLAHPFGSAISGVRAFLWADLDGDGDPDAALLDGQGRLHLFENQRAGRFQPWTTPGGIGETTALSIADIDHGGSLDIVALGADGILRKLTYAESAPRASRWTASEILRPVSAPADGTARLLWADLDNNGGQDLVVTSSAGSSVWLDSGSGTLLPLATPVNGRLLSVSDPSQAHLDLVGLSPAGQPVLLRNHGTKHYHWQVVRPRAAYLAASRGDPTAGDKRINSFGIGGAIELRAGLLYQQQLITGPSLHFGLGTYTRTDAMRILWPNGIPQGEFELAADQVQAAPQRLKGSCPWLFAYDGHAMRFVTDFLWRSALGLRIDAQNTAGVAMTGDWNKIRGDQLAPRNGFYDLRLTTQLWETYYFDTLSLMTVDHPVGTEIWVDERFSVPPPALAYHVMGPARPIRRAVDSQGRDVTARVRVRDNQYLDVPRGPYQGIARDHYVEVDLDDAQAAPGPLWLLAEGWLHPTDSSINLAISQGTHPRPHGIALEIPNGRGGWKAVQSDLGFPEGKNKTILINLTGLFPAGVSHRLRLRTNLEIYWDWIASANELPQTPTRVRHLAAASAQIRYHGFNAVNQASPSAPAVPDYEQLAATGRRWRDMTGFFTRYGDVRELLSKIDDRYVIMDAGDEIALRFPVPPPPAPGWTRDFIMVGDGWGKDCDLNSGFSDTVLPLPSHADRFYTRRPGRLQDEPVYKQHRRDWETYQTRYVTPRPFDQALLPPVISGQSGG